MNTETETLIAVLNSRMEKMTDSERIDLMRELMNGYCMVCGREETEGRCQCWNDS